MNTKYTIFVLKPDAIERHIVDEILNVISNDYQLVGIRSLILDRNNIYKMKKDEWLYGWETPPTKEVIEFIYQYETRRSLVVLCEIKGNCDAIKYGRKLKGERHLAEDCNKESIRGMFYDKEAAANTRIYYGKVSLVFDGDTPISIPPNIIHSVDTTEEFMDLAGRSFGSKFTPFEGGVPENLEYSISDKYGVEVS